MIKFYKVEKNDTLLVVDTDAHRVYPYNLSWRTTSELENLTEWWMCVDASRSAYCDLRELVYFLEHGIEEIK